jgi:hypothetical protein
MRPAGSSKSNDMRTEHIAPAGIIL